MDDLKLLNFLLESTDVEVFKQLVYPAVVLFVNFVFFFEWYMSYAVPSFMVPWTSWWLLPHPLFRQWLSAFR